MIISFYIVAAILLVSALGVVLFKNPIHSALCLVGHLCTVAAVYALLQAHFLALAQVIVYAGAIMVLVLFVLMLLNLKLERVKISVVAVVVLMAAALAFMALFARGFEEMFSVFNAAEHATSGTAAHLGQRLFSGFYFPFELVSVLILAAIVGAVVLARQSKKPAAQPPPEAQHGAA
jgi:NADH-quinone oxidoreductase subunit J